jgi:hypothetical protein
VYLPFEAPGFACAFFSSPIAMDLKGTTIEEELVAVWKLAHEGRAKFFSPFRRISFVTRVFLG